MCVVGLRKASSNLFPRERERQNTKSATFRSYTEESKTTFQAKSNVQNKKTLSSSREATLAYRSSFDIIDGSVVKLYFDILLKLTEATSVNCFSNS